MENKFTTGPWRVISSKDGPYSIVTDETLFEAISKPGAILSEANSRLIASAPELLEMLQNVLEDLESGRLKHVDGDVTFEVKEVIKKAKGV